MSTSAPMPPGRRRSGFSDQSWTQQVGWVLLPLRAFLAVVFLDGGISKIADSRFLNPSSPASMRATVAAVRHSSPIGGLLGPVQDHSVGFGLVMAIAELAVGVGLLLGLFTRLAAAGGMLLALSLWLTVSWHAGPWFTSADVVYLVALSPLLIAGAGGVLSADGWLAAARELHPSAADDRTRRLLLAGGAAVLGALLLGGASLFRRSTTSTAAGSGGVPQTSAPDRNGQNLIETAKVPVGGAVAVTDPVSGDQAWVLQLTAGHFTALDAACPHQGCPVSFVSAQDGFSCPCHGSQFDASGHVLRGPATRDLPTIPVTVSGAEVRRGSG
jgi:thiosulfate dehydrogenase (quinone) large subunit